MSLSNTLEGKYVCKNQLDTWTSGHTKHSPISFPKQFLWKKVYMLEANQSQNRGVPLFFPTDSHPESLFDLLQNDMSTSRTMKAYAQEV